MHDPWTCLVCWLRFIAILASTAWIVTGMVLMIRELRRPKEVFRFQPRFDWFPEISVRAIPSNKIAWPDWFLEGSVEGTFINGEGI